MGLVSTLIEVFRSNAKARWQQAALLAALTIEAISKRFLFAWVAG